MNTNLMDRIVRGAIVAFLLLVAHGRGVAQGTMAMEECSKCDIKTTTMARAHVDPKTCPGANAVVCDLQYDQDTSAKCVSPGDVYKDCKPDVDIKKKYNTTTYVAGVCGTDNGATFTCPAANGPAGPQVERPGKTCTGSPWIDAITLPLYKQFYVEVVVPDGTTPLPASGIGTLRRTILAVPAGLFRSGQVKLANDEFRFDVVIAVFAPSRFSFPSQAFKPIPLDEHVRLIASEIRGRDLVLHLAIRKANLGAFYSYSVDLGGLRVAIGPPLKARIAPNRADRSTSLSDPSVMGISATVTSGYQELISGAGAVAKIQLPRRARERH